MNMNNNIELFYIVLKINKNIDLFHIIIRNE